VLDCRAKQLFEEGTLTMKHVSTITRTPVKAEIPVSSIIEAISAVLSVIAGVLGAKEGTA